MATAGVINGTDLLLYVDGTAIGSSTSHSISYTHSPRDTTNKGSGGATTRLEGLTDWSGSCDGFLALDDSYGASDLFTLISARTKVTLKFSTEETGDAYWTGDAYLTGWDLDAPLEESSTYSISFEAAGALSQADVS